MGFGDLANYKPEKVKEGNFELITGRGIICKVNSSMVEHVEGGTRKDTGEAYEPYDKLSYELEIVEGEHQGRRVWKSFNLSSDKRFINKKTGKEGKTPVEKLADMFFTLGLEFSDLESLKVANAQFVEKLLKVSFSKFKPENKDEEVQTHTITGVANGVAQAKGTTQSDVPF